jgi:hypothetical protein
MKRIVGFLAVSFFAATLALAAEQTWTGKISDSSCGHSHKSAIEHAGKKLSNHDCTVACVKNGGKYVLVVGSKTYEIANQDFNGLEEHAGHEVRLTGDTNGDSITVTKIGMKE